MALSDLATSWLDKHQPNLDDKTAGEVANTMADDLPDAKHDTLRRYVLRWGNGKLGKTHDPSAEDPDPDEEIPEVPDSPDAPPKEAVGLEPLDREYRYDDEGDFYEVYLQSAGGRVRVDGETAREMKRLYSREVGDAETINEICRKFGWRRKTFREFKRALNFIHDEDRYLDEEHQRRETSDLVKETVQARRAQYVQERNREVWQEIKADADKWRRWRAEVAQPLLDGIAGAALDDVPKPDADPEDLAAVLYPADGHLDQEGYDGAGLEENIDRWLGCHSTICERIQRIGAPEVTYLVLGSDQFNVDTDGGTTTSGTPQHNATRPAAAITQVAEAGCQAIEIARRLGDVVVRVVPGNHDRRSCQLYLWSLQQRYADVDDVEVRGPPEVRQYEMYGDNLLCWAHGDHIGGGKTKKAQRLASVVASEAATSWGQSSHRYAHVGHLHHSWEYDDAIRVQQVPTVTEPDEYHHREGYVTAQRAQIGWIYERSGGQMARVEATAEG